MSPDCQVMGIQLYGEEVSLDRQGMGTTLHGEEVSPDRLGMGTRLHGEEVFIICNVGSITLETMVGEVSACCE